MGFNSGFKGLISILSLEAVSTLTRTLWRGNMWPKYMCRISANGTIFGYYNSHNASPPQRTRTQQGVFRKVWNLLVFYRMFFLTLCLNPFECLDPCQLLPGCKAPARHSIALRATWTQARRSICCRVQLKRDGTRWRTGEESERETGEWSG